MTHPNPTIERAIDGIERAIRDAYPCTCGEAYLGRGLTAPDCFHCVPLGEALAEVSPMLRSLVATVERETVERAVKIAEQPRIFDAMSGACGVPPYGAETAAEIRSLLPASTREEKP